MEIRGGQAFSSELKHADTMLRGSKDLDFSVRQVRGPGRENSCREGGDFGLTEFSLLSLHRQGWQRSHLPEHRLGGGIELETHALGLSQPVPVFATRAWPGGGMRREWVWKGPQLLSLEVTPLSLEGRERPSSAGSDLSSPLTVQHFSREGRTVGHLGRKLSADLPMLPSCRCTRVPAESLTCEQACSHRPSSSDRLLSE